MRRLSAAGIQSAFQFYNINSYETVERLIRRGVYKGPLVMNWVAIGGGMDQPTIYSLANFLRAIPDGSMLTVESSMLNVLPINMMGIAMGLHVRCGIEDNLWNQSRTGEDDHRAADRAAGAHRRASSAATSPAARKHARSARSACSTTRWKRRWPPTASPRTPRAGSRASCARSREATMAHAIRFHQAGGPEVLRIEEVAVGSPGPGQARIRHVAVGLNFADTYFRTGLYPVPLPNGMGVEASGVVEAVGEGVTNVAPGDRVTYTGFVNTLGAYSTERLDPGGAADQAAGRDLVRDRGGDDDARTDVRRT